MALVTKAPRGTQDVLPSESYQWKFLEKTAMEISSLYGFQEIRFPTFEHTELFNRSVGDTTDVVQKEMYTFLDKGNRSVTLRPEGTAGTVRTVLEHGLLGDALPLRVSYLCSCFRYEKPQAGRLREFHQFGCEMFGAESPSADAQLIAMVDQIFRTLGIENLALEINSIGCPNCRPVYLDKLRAYFSAHLDSLCETCRSRLEKNPMRILDCKCPTCKEVAKGAPVVLDCLCEECSSHFEGLKSRLEALGIPYSVDPTIVRGLDYYTKTVFEFVSHNIGAQGTVCGGGRYDGLVAELGGKPTPALGFAMGLERILLVMRAAGIEIPAPKSCQLYIAPMGEAASVKAVELAAKIRAEGFFADTDTMGRSLKAQMKYADKIGAEYVLVLGENEIAEGRAKLKKMASGEQTEVSLDDRLVQKLYDITISQSIADLTDAIEGQNLV